ncbi:tRNA A58 N-methylase Trm61 [Clostridium pascui]|uniref:class I SAM-dependent methyltransferase n=1 Tax=Clostridium pascui TaxID=46609 RepID=UPI001956461C|nr:class I SAM-dependent methyltransferase [Clostridium pascui]MBM7869810.1 tRNA A58 N-methylase Trm61 [Clostridium pascui]
MSEFFTNSMNIAKEICRLKIKNGDKVVDATVGKGSDTLFLASLVGEEGEVYSFDIQSEAIQATKEKLENNNIKTKVNLILDGHENIDRYVEGGVKIVMFNLGYLPSFSHNITTKAHTTIEAVQKSLKLLVPKGVVILVIYHGHENGKAEKEALENYTKTLNQKEYNVAQLEFTNQINYPPQLLIIEKR